MTTYPHPGERQMQLGVAFFSLACVTTRSLWLGLAGSILLVVAVVVLLWRRRPAHAVAFGTIAGLAITAALGVLAVDQLDHMARAREPHTQVFETVGEGSGR